MRPRARQAALILHHPDSIVALRAPVASELHDRHLPVVMLDDDQHDMLQSDPRARIYAGTGTAVRLHSIYTSAP